MNARIITSHRDVEGQLVDFAAYRQWHAIKRRQRETIGTDHDERASASTSTVSNSPLRILWKIPVVEQRKQLRLTTEGCHKERWR